MEKMRFKSLKPSVQNYIEKRLVAWAEWFSKIENNGLGYHKQSMEYVLMTSGVMSDGCAAMKPLPINEAAEEIERAICSMSIQGGYKERSAIVLREHYLRPRLRQKDEAKAIKMSYTQYRMHLEMAYHWIYGWLTGKGEI